MQDWELEKWEFLDINEIESMMDSPDYEIESWSKIIYEDIKKYLM